MGPSPCQAAAAVVALDYADLVSGADLTAEVERAFGYDGLGLLTVQNVPGVATARGRLLPLAARFASLPDPVKVKYEHAASFYAVGWSHGREKLQGRPDVSKGSYYANPLRDVPFDDPQAIAEYPAFAEPNVWPHEELPELRPAFMEAGRLMHHVGCLVAKQCDAFVHSRCAGYAPTRLFDVLSSSRCCKGRLLHYFPMPADGAEASAHDTEEAEAVAAAAEEAEAGADAVEEGEAGADAVEEGEAGADAVEEAEASAHAAEEAEASGHATGSLDDEFSTWCGWHNDHGSLTALMPAIYLHTDGADVTQVPCPDEAAGLYVRARSGELVRACIPSDHLAFQIGETAQIHSGGLLQATPHAVRGAKAPGVSRETFAVFMEPEWDYPMSVPAGMDPEEAQSTRAAELLPKGVPPLKSRWGSASCPFTTCDFGGFTSATLSAYH